MGKHMCRSHLKLPAILKTAISAIIIVIMGSSDLKNSYPWNWSYGSWSYTIA